MLCSVVAAAGVVPDSEDAEASLRDVLAAALEANRELAQLAGGCGQRTRGQAAELEKLRADLAVLQRMVFGRSSERSRPESPGGDGDASAPAGRTPGSAQGRNAARGRGRDGVITRICPGSRCPGIFLGAGTAARSAESRSRCWGDHVSGEQLDT